jgi:hypothetical protein
MDVVATTKVSSQVKVQLGIKGEALHGKESGIENVTSLDGRLCKCIIFRRPTLMRLEKNYCSKLAGRHYWRERCGPPCTQLARKELVPDLRGRSREII